MVITHLHSNIIMHDACDVYDLYHTVLHTLTSQFYQNICKTFCKVGHLCHVLLVSLMHQTGILAVYTIILVDHFQI